MNNIKIFLSKEENFLESALKIKNYNTLKVEILYIEDFVLNDFLKQTEFGEVLYFLCNSPLTSQIVKSIRKNNYYIINQSFFEKNFDKSYIQKRLNDAHINTPKLINYEDLNGADFPIFCKSKKHSDITFQVYNKNTIIKFFEKFNKDDFYFEKAVLGNEIKIYYVDNQAYNKSSEKMDDNIQDMCLKISKLFNLEIFSADFIINTKNIIIDINPSPGFFLSNDARNGFINFVHKIYSKGSGNKCKII